MIRVLTTELQQWRVALGQAVLDGCRALKTIDGATEFGQETVTHQFE